MKTPNEVNKIKVNLQFIFDILEFIIENIFTWDETKHKINAKVEHFLLEFTRLFTVIAHEAKPNVRAYLCDYAQ